MIPDALDMSQLNLPQGKTTTKKWKTEKKLKSKKTNMLRCNSKQSGESGQSVLKKKRKATVERICGKGRFRAWNERLRGDGILLIMSMNVSSITTV